MKICPSCQLKYPDNEARCFVDGAVLEGMADPRIGTLLAGRYMIESQLGEGGMAVVYRARSQLVDKPVAVKVMNAGLVRDQSLKERFRREAKNSAALAHPNIVEILDYGEEEGVPYLVMELLDGSSLDKLVERGPMALAQAAAIGAQIARGLARAHDFQVIHRDLKPENVFIAKGPGGRPIPKILDFGIARSVHDSRLTSAGQIFGTPQYMAPERMMSVDAGPGADLYALGIMLFEMVAGQLPFKADDVPGYLVAHMKDTPPKLGSLVQGVPPAFEDLVQRLLAKKPEERPVDAHQVEKALLQFAPANLVAELPAPATTGPSSRTNAATLPPTTLERWGQRSLVFEEMARRAYPTGNIPTEFTRMVGEIKGTIMRMHDLRASGLRDQRKLEQMAAEAKEGRQRLGRAMAALGEDLSKSRVTLRDAENHVRPWLQADQSFTTEWGPVVEQLGRSGILSRDAIPSDQALALLRHAAEVMGRAVQTTGGAKQARDWLAGHQHAVKDLEFQCDALRQQLEKVETGYETEREALETSLTATGRELEGLDRRLTEIGTTLVSPLRARPDLGDLVARLDVTGGTPASGLQRH
jgi:eukaryotic-like serine/threonine-protein kinase